MTRRSPRPGRRGSSMLELLVVVSITGLLAGLALPQVAAQLRESRLNTMTRRLATDIRRTRALAVSGRLISGASGPSTSVKARVAGIRFDSATRYSVFLDPDEDPGNFNEIDLKTVDLEEIDLEGNFKITQPVAGTQIRFRRNGSTTVQELVVADPGQNKRRSIVVTAVGQTRIKPI
jgi:Tfp pilus assembly protein FimT